MFFQQCTDERLKRTNDIFLGIKLIKLNAWEKVFQDKIGLARDKELKYLNKDSFYWTVMSKYVVNFNYIRMKIHF